MKLSNVERIETPDYCSLIGSYERDNGQSITLHFSVSQEDDHLLNDGADCFFTLGVIYAFVLKEDYKQDEPVDPILARNIRSLTRQWCQWYSHVRPISIYVDYREAQQHRTDKYASFFSGGVDSLFTNVTHRPSIESLISVEHKAYSKDEILEGLARLKELNDYPEASGKQHIRIVSILMYVFPEVLDAWAFMAHGAAYIAVAHLLSPKIGNVVLSSSYSFGELACWGSHPLTDPLVSSAALAASNFGGTYTRVEKTQHIAADELALSQLSVCGYGRLEGQFVNCSKCQKCLRTMMTLDMLDIDRTKATSFDWSKYSPEQMSKVFLRTEGEAIFCREIRDAAIKSGRHDIASACNKALKRSRPFVVLTKAELFMRRRFPSILKHRKRLLSIRTSVYSVLGLRKSADV